MSERDALYELVTELLGNVVVRTDATGLILYASESARRVFGYAPEEMVGKNGRDFIHPEDLPAQRASFHALAAAGGDVLPPFRSRAICKDGAYLVTQNVCRVVRDQDGAIVEMMTATRDITAQVDAEVALQNVLEALPEPACVHDRGRIVHVNRALLALLEWDRAEDFVGRPATDFVHPEDVEFVARRVVSTQKNRRTPEHRLVSRRGTVIPVEVTGVPFLYHGVLAALAVVHDLRERKQVEAQLAAAERLATLGRVAAAVGHEVNNPLTYLLGSLELLRRDIARLAPPAAHGPLLARIQSAEDGAIRVRDIARDLKALSAPPRDEDVQRVDLHDVLDRALETAAHEVAPRARIVRDEEADLPAVAAHDGRLIQVFVNLLTNAAHATPIGDGEAAAEIRLVARRAGRHVTVEVRDEGCGFAPEDAERLFEPFFTTKGAGTGLGLSIARHLVVAMGGTLVATARQPRGACFRVTLRVHSGAIMRRPASSAPPENVPATRRARILFADDEAMILDVARAALDPHEVVTAASGREAIRLLAEGAPFDAIVCDLHMDDLGGADVYEWIVAHRPELARRIAFTTGGVFTDRARSVLTRAQRPVMDKPFDFDKLTAVVGAILAT